MRKIIKKWGDSAIITFDRESLKVIGANIGDHLDIQINAVHKEVKNDNN